MKVTERRVFTENSPIIENQVHHTNYIFADLQTSRTPSFQPENTGVRLSEEHKSKIFTPLFTTKLKGRGFVLAMCKKLVKAQDR